MAEVGGKPPEKDFIAQALKNTYWLRDEIEKVLGSKVWITPVVVFTNAFVPAGKPIKGVWVVNKKYLPSLFQRQARSGSNLAAVWAARDQIARKFLRTARNLYQFQSHRISPHPSWDKNKGAISLIDS